MQQIIHLRVEAPVELDHRARVLGILPPLRLLLRLGERLVIHHLLPHARKIRVRHHHVRGELLAPREAHAAHSLRRLAAGDLRRALAERLGEDRLHLGAVRVATPSSSASFC